MPGFVIQKHTSNNPTHWDLMIQRHDHLATWQIDQPPDLWPHGPLPAQKIQNHRLLYLTYQGPLSDNRGAVAMTDHGDYSIIAIDDAFWLLHLAGQTLLGRLELQLDRENLWRLTFTPDQGHKP